MSRKSNEDPKISGNGRIESPDTRENVLAILENGDDVKGKLRLALVLDDQGFQEDAENTYRKVMEKRREAQGPRDQVISFCQVKISSLLRQRALYAEAEDQCKRVLLSVESTGPTSSLYLQAAGNLALIWKDRGKLDSAFAKIRDILGNEMCSPYQDARHVRLVTILAIILRECGHYDLSFFLTKAVLRVSDALFGNDDPFTLDVGSEMSQILNDTGSHHLSEELARQAFYRFGEQLGTQHPQCSKAASRLANATRFNDPLGDGMKRFERTLKAQELRLGSNHPDTVSTRWGLAATYASGSRFRDSASILNQTLVQQRTIFSQESHPDIDWTLQAIERVHTFQRALRTKSTSKSEVEEEFCRMSEFFGKPFRGERRNLQLLNAVSFSQKDSGEVRSQSDPQILTAAHDVSTNDKKASSSSTDKAPMNGLFGTALHVACFEGNLEFVRAWLNSGKDINVKSGVFESPLCAASYGGHLSIVKLLLKAGANVKDPGRYGFSALQSALSMGHVDVAKILLKAGANFEVSDHWYGNALHEASMNGQESIVNLLLKAKADPNAVTGIFGTALGAAAWKGNLPIVKALIKNGAIVDTEVDGRTATDLVVSRRHQDILKILD